jgi:hypothetical protein
MLRRLVLGSLILGRLILACPILGCPILSSLSPRCLILRGLILCCLRFGRRGLCCPAPAGAAAAGRRSVTGLAGIGLVRARVISAARAGPELNLAEASRTGLGRTDLARRGSG